MAIEVVDRKSKWLGTAEEYDWLVGNFGDWKTFELEIECIVDFRTRRDSSISVVTEGSNIMFIIDDGSNWKDWGIYGSDGINKNCRITRVITEDGGEARNDITNAPPVGGPNTVNGNVLTFPVSVMEVGGITANTYPFTTSDGAGVQTVVNLIFRMFDNTTSDPYIEELIMSFSLIDNDLLQSNSLNSIVDGTKTGFRATALNTYSQDDVVDLVPFGFKSGMAIREATIKKIDSRNQFLISITYMMHGLFQILAKFKLGEAPVYLQDQESLTENFEIKAWTTQNNRNISISMLNKESSLGNVGWIGENFNGHESKVFVRNVIIKDVFGNVYDSVPYNIETVLTCDIISHTSPMPNIDTIGFGIMHIPIDRSDYSKNNNTFLDNFYVNSLGKGSDDGFIPVEPVIQEFEGYGLDGIQINVVPQVSSEAGDSVQVRITISPNTAFSEFMESSDEDDRLCFMWLSAQSSGTLPTSDRSTMQLVFEQFEKALPIVGEYDNLTARFLTHAETNQTGEKTAHTKPNDDLLGKLQLWLPNASVFNMTGITYAIEMIKSTGHKFILDSQFLDTSQAVILEDGTQQINVSQTRGFKTIDGSNRNFVSLERDITLDAGSLNGYKGVFGWKNRWEYWLPITNDDVNSDFFDETQMHTGYNHQWERYVKKNGWDIHFVVYVHGTEADGNEIIYRNTHKYFIGDYDDNDNISTQFFFKNADTGAALVGGTDIITGKNLGIILSVEQTVFEIHYTLATGVWTQQILDLLYATATIEVDEGPGYLSMRQISTVVGQEAGNPLVPLNMQFLKWEIDTNTTKLIVTFNVNPAELDVGSRYRFTGRIGCKGAVITGQYNEQYNEQYD